jgi:hypothetical protein
MENELFAVDVYGAEQCLWRYVVKETGRNFAIAPPTFELDGERVGGALARVAPQQTPVSSDVESLPDGLTQHTYSGRLYGAPKLSLEMAFTFAEDSPAVGFRYRLLDQSGHALSSQSEGTVDYAGLSLAGLDRCTEVSIDGQAKEVSAEAFDRQEQIAGPILMAGDDIHTLLIAYEGLSEVMAGSVGYELMPERRVRLRALDGAGQSHDQALSYQTMWMTFAAVRGDETALLEAHQAFLRRG